MQETACDAFQLIFVLAGIPFEHFSEGFFKGTAAEKLLACIEKLPELPLACPVSRDKTVILGEGQDLRKAIEKLLKFYNGKGPEITKPKIKLTDNICSQIISKTKEHLENIIEKALETEAGKLYSNCATNLQIDDAKAYLLSVIDSFNKKPELVAGLLDAVVSSEKNSHLEYSALSALGSMACLANYRNIKQSNEAIITMGIAGLLQDISLIIGIAQDGKKVGNEEHAIASKKISEMLGCDKVIQQTIANHHSVVDEKGNPLYNRKNKIPVYQRVIVSVNEFLEASKYYSKYDTMLLMHELARIGYADLNAVVSLGSLYIGYNSEKEILAAIAAINKRKCGYNGVVFPLVNEESGKVVAIFCSKKDCDSCGNGISRRYKTLMMEIPGTGRKIEIANGDYLRCTALSDAFNEISEGLWNRQSYGIAN